MKAATVSAFALTCAALCVVDGLRVDHNEVRLARGGSARVVGFGDPVTDVPPGLTLTVDGLGADTWLGRPQWRGRLDAAADAVIGRFQIGDLEVFVVTDARALRSADPSVIRRASGLSPWTGAGMNLALGLGAGGVGVFWMRRKARDLAAEGRAEVFMIRPSASGGSLLAFADLAVAVGDRLSVVRDGAVCGTAVVTSLEEGAAVAESATAFEGRARLEVHRAEVRS